MNKQKKAAIFDFDGTITDSKLSVWQKCWKRIGFSLDKNKLCAQLYIASANNKISYEKYCDLTCDIFKSRNFSYNMLKEIAEQTKIKDGFREAIFKLKQEGFDIFIISGGIIENIKLVLKDLYQEFKFISANKMLFDENGIISKIIPTKFDREGKAVFIDRIIKEKGYLPQNIVFFGNGDNDEFVKPNTGIKTICITPDGTTDPSNKNIWEKHENNITKAINSVIEN